MEPDAEVPERPRPPRQDPAAYKLRVLEEYEQLDKQGKGALLRREALYASLISEWRKQRDKGALAALQQRRGRPPADPRDQRLARLERDNARLREQLARARKVIEVQGTLRAAGQAREPAAPPGTTASRAADRDGHHSAGPDRGCRRRVPGGRPAPLELVPSAPPVAAAATAAPGPAAAAACAVCGRAAAGPGRAPPGRFWDAAPATVYATLLDEGDYLCSTSTMYRLLRQRGRPAIGAATPPGRVKPELLATKPNQCWSWGITKLAGPARWTWFYLSTILDIYSR